MKIILAAVDEHLAKAWRTQLGLRKDVTIYEGSILDLPAQAVISPANSFSYMDGGVDMVYTNYFGWDLMERLQREVKKRPMQELLVGEALVVPTNSAKHPYLISAPTMRV